MKAKLIVMDGNVYRIPSKMAERIASEAEKNGGEIPDRDAVIGEVKCRGLRLGEIFMEFSINRHEDKSKHD